MGLADSKTERLLLVQRFAQYKLLKARIWEFAFCGMSISLTNFFITAITICLDILLKQ